MKHTAAYRPRHTSRSRQRNSNGSENLAVGGPELWGLCCGRPADARRLGATTGGGHRYLWRAPGQRAPLPCWLVEAGGRGGGLYLVAWQPSISR